MNISIANIQSFFLHPLVLLVVFMAASLAMIWLLHMMESKGFEGTVLGTLIMPYCSGFPNLVFAYVMSSSAKNGGLVIENCLVNNATNLTLILGLAAIFGATAAIQKRVSKRESRQREEFHRINRLNLLFTLIALFLFTGTLWALAKDGVLDFYDGLVLVSLFLFWQVLHVFEVLKDNIRKNRSFHWSLLIDILLLGVSAYCVYFSVEHLVDWVKTSHTPYLSFARLGWFSGLLMVVPNAVLALYYTRIDRQDIVMSSQIGDGHICIPMCIGLFAVFKPIHVPDFFQIGAFIILGAGAVHFLSLVMLGKVPRSVGVGLIGAYAFFLYKGLIQ